MGSLLLSQVRVSLGLDGIGGGSEGERYWLDWSDWSTCDHTCGHGSKVRTRNCQGGFPAEPGCQGASVERTGFTLILILRYLRILIQPLAFPCAKLAHFGLWEAIARDWDIVERRAYRPWIVSKFRASIYLTKHSHPNTLFASNYISFLWSLTFFQYGIFEISIPPRSKRLPPTKLKANHIKSDFRVHDHKTTRGSFLYQALNSN